MSSQQIEMQGEYIRDVSPNAPDAPFPLRRLMLLLLFTSLFTGTLVESACVRKVFLETPVIFFVIHSWPRRYHIVDFVDGSWMRWFDDSLSNTPYFGKCFGLDVKQYWCGTMNIGMCRWMIIIEMGMETLCGVRGWWLVVWLPLPTVPAENWKRGKYL